jgi:hypothetical protein
LTAKAKGINLISTEGNDCFQSHSFVSEAGSFLSLAAQNLFCTAECREKQGRQIQPAEAGSAD